MKRKFNEMIHSSFQQKIFYSLLLILFLCILPLLVMGFYSHPVGDDYTYGLQTHLAWKNTGSPFAVIRAAAGTAQSFWHSYQGPFASAFFMALQPAVISERLAWKNTGSPFAVIRAAAGTAQSFWHSYQGPFASAFFMALQPAVISERLYALSPFIMLFMLIFSTSLFLRILLVKYFRLPAVSVNIITCVQLLFSIELLEAPSEAFFWYCGAVHYVFMQSCLLLLISVLLLAARSEKRTWLYILLSLPLALCCGGANFVTALTSMILFACALLFLLLLRARSEKRTWLYILLSLPLALCCGGANFVTALTSMILFACALLFLLLLRKKRELLIILPSFIVNTAAFILNVTAPGNRVREAEQLASLPPVQAVYHKKRELLIILPSFIVNTAAFILNVTAPGNRVREAEQLASLPPVQAVYHAFRYCIEYLGKWTNLYVLLGIIFLIPIIWTAVSKLKIRLRLPGLFTLFSFCLLSSMFAPSTYALGLVVIYGRSLNIIMQAYYLLLILNLLYWIGWFRQNLPLTDKDTKYYYAGILPFADPESSLLDRMVSSEPSSDRQRYVSCPSA